MKNTAILITCIFIFTGIFSDIVVLDEQNMEPVPYVIMRIDSGPRRQVMTPIMLTPGTSGTMFIEAMGYENCEFKMNAGRTDTVFLKRHYQEMDTVRIESESISSLNKAVNDPVSSVRTMLELSPVADIKRYSRTASVSIEGSSPEQVLISVNGFPVVNPASGNIDPDLLGSISMGTVEASRKNAFTGMGTSVFSGNVDFMNADASRFRIGLNNTALSYGLFYRFGILKAGIERQSFNDMVLPGNVKLENSYKIADNLSVFLMNELFTGQMILSNTLSGDPGLEGSRFEHAQLRQELKLLQGLARPYQNGRILLSMNEYYYQYDNDEQTSPAHDYSTARYMTGGFEHLISGTLAGISLAYSDANGSRIGFHSRVSTDAYANIDLGGLFIQLKGSYPFAGSIGIMRRNVNDGRGYETGMRYVSRKPTFNELYWDDYYTKGNEGLDDEHMYSAYHNTFYSFSVFSLTVTSGINVMTNQIEWVPEGNIWTAVNNKRVFNPYAGISAGIKWGILSLDGFLSASPYIVDNVGDYHILFDDMNAEVYPYIGDLYSIQRYRPPLYAGLKMDIAYRGFSFYADSKYKSIRYITNANTTFLPDYFIIDNAGVEYSHAKWKLMFNVSNPLDIRIEDIRGYTVEGRAIQISLSMEV